MNLKAITFDATGTLFYIPGGVGTHYAAIAAEFGGEGEASEIDRAFRSAWQTSPRPVRRGERSPDDDRSWWLGLVREVAEKAELRVNDFDAFFHALYDHFATLNGWAVFPEVREVIEQLSGRFRLGVISDFDGRLRALLEASGLSDFFDEVLISSEEGADKPDPHLFHSAAERLGCQPGEMMHVGDDPQRDWQGAKDAGCQVFQLDRKKNSLRELLLYLQGVCVRRHLHIRPMTQSPIILAA